MSIVLIGVPRMQRFEISPARGLNGRRDAGIKRGMYDYYSRGEFDFAREVTRRRSIWRGEKSRAKTKGIELLCTSARHARNNAKIITLARLILLIHYLVNVYVRPINILSNNWPRPYGVRVAARNMMVGTSVMIKSIKRNGVIVASIRRDKPTRRKCVRVIASARY